MEYLVYHDESKKYGFWHCIYLLTVSEREEIIGLLKAARKHCNYTKEIKFSKIDKKEKKESSKQN